MKKIIQSSVLLLLFSMSLLLGCTNENKVDYTIATKLSEAQVAKLKLFAVKKEMVGEPETTIQVDTSQKIKVTLHIATQNYRFNVFVDENGNPVDSAKSTSSTAMILVNGTTTCTSSCTGETQCTLTGCKVDKDGECTIATCVSCTVTCGKSSSCIAIGKLNVKAL